MHSNELISVKIDNLLNKKEDDGENEIGKINVPFAFNHDSENVDTDLVTNEFSLTKSPLLVQNFTDK